MKFTKLLFILMFINTYSISWSQEYLQMIEEETYTVEEIVNVAEAYFADKDKGRGSGYVQFKRWEYMANRLKDENGYITPFAAKLQELERQNAYLNSTSENRVPLSDNWEELGPDYWSATTSWNPGVGRITGIAIDETNSNHIIIGANTGGVWRSIDAGATWTPMGDYFSNLYVYSVAIDPMDSDTYYFGSNSGRIYKSTDAGATWNLLGVTGTSIVNKILLHPTDANLMFATSQNSGIYSSTDAGANWTKVIPQDNRGYDVEFKPGDTNTVYASGLGFYVSTDGGVSFNSISGFENEPKMIGVSPDDATVVYVVEANGGSFGGLYKSSNSGTSFTELNHDGRNYFGYDTAGFDPGGQAPRDMDVAVNPENIDEVHIAGILTWRSLDGGENFTCTADWVPGSAASAGIGYCHADVDILLFNGTTLFAGTDGGIFKATNTLDLNENYYEDLTTGMGIRQFYKIGISQTEDVVVSGGSQDNGTSFYTEASGWIDWLGADGMETFIDKNDPNIMYGTSQFGQLYRTDNAAASVQFLQEPGIGGGNWVTPYEQDPIDINTIYVGYDVVHKSTNKGINWTTISQNFGQNLDEMKIAPSNNQIMYASRGGILFKTEDGGATDWIQTVNAGGSINSIAIHPTNPQKIAVTTTSAQKVRVSENGGQTWESYLFNLPDFSALAIVWDDNGQDGLYVGLDYGIYYIDNTFTEWQPFFTNIPNVIVNELEINVEDEKIYAGTYGRGLWASPKFEPEIILTTPSVLSQIAITIAPNPVSNEVNILGNLESEVDIRVFDISGKLLIYKSNIPFSNSYSFDVSTLDNGAYFVRLGTNLGTITKKIIKQ